MMLFGLQGCVAVGGHQLVEPWYQGSGGGIAGCTMGRESMGMVGLMSDLAS
jgi:hypothetical protein